MSDVEEKIDKKLEHPRVKLLYQGAIFIWIVAVLVMGFLMPFSKCVPLLPKLLLLVPLIILIHQYRHLEDEPEKQSKDSHNDIIYPAYLLLFLIFRNIQVRQEACQYINTILIIILLMVIASSFDFYLPAEHRCLIRHVRIIAWSYIGGLLMFVSYLVYITFNKSCEF